MKGSTFLPANDNLFKFHNLIIGIIEDLSKEKYIGCYQQLAINLCEPPEMRGFWGEETTATFHSCFFEIPPPELTFTFNMWGSHERLFSGRPSDSDLPQAWPFPGSHPLQPCPRQVGPLGQRSVSITFATRAVPYIGLVDMKLPRKWTAPWIKCLY